MLCDLQYAGMNTTRYALLFLSMLVAGSVAHRLLEANSQEQNKAFSEAAEHQRILSELEEVHQLRERMLQQGEQGCTHILCRRLLLAALHAFPYRVNAFQPCGQLSFATSLHSVYTCSLWLVDLTLV